MRDTKQCSFPVSVPLTRRGFLRSSSLALAGLAMTPAFRLRAAETLRTTGTMALHRIPINNIRAAGWIADWADTARRGSVSDTANRGKFRTTWVNPEMVDALSLEQVAFWLDGALRLGILLEDRDLIEMVGKRINPIIQHLPELDDDGIGFMWFRKLHPPQVSAKLQQGFCLWASACIARVLAVEYERTGNTRILRTLEAGFRRPTWGDPRNEKGKWRVWYQREDVGMESALAALRAGGKGNLEAVVEHGLNRIRTIDAAQMLGEPAPGKGWWPGFGRCHAAMGCENLHLPAICYPESGDAKMIEASHAAFLWLLEDTVLPTGVTSGDESMHGRFAFRGTETCAVADWVWALLKTLEVSGESWLADMAETAWFNAAPQCMTRDYMRHVYFQSPNRLFDEMGDPTKGRKEGRYARGRGEYAYHEIFPPECCTGSVNKIVPPYPQHAWMATADEGLAWCLYGPCRLEATVKGVKVRLESVSPYPFVEDIELEVTPEKPVAFPMRLRVPGWCENPSVSVNGKAIPVARDARGFTTVKRKWQSGDRLALRLPMKVRFEAGREEGGSPYGCIFYGPLLMVHGLPEVNENTPRHDAKWQYALDIAGPERLAEARVERKPMPEKWRWQFDAPLTVTVPAREVEWKPVPLREEPPGYKPPSRTHENSWPGRPTLPYEPLEGGKPVKLRLIPYGCARFRLSMFPITRESAWALPSAGAATTEALSER